jgi:hypothetical protein
MVPSSGFEPLKLAQRCLRPSPLTGLGKDGEKNSFTSFRRLMVLDWIPTYLHIGERNFHCANQRCIADKGIEPMTSRSQCVYYTNHQRGQPDLNRRPNELQSFALPLSYGPSNYTHGFASCLFNTLNNADRGDASWRPCLNS